MSGNGRLPEAATPVRRILALGGHEFSSRPPDRAVCELLLRLAHERGGVRPRICILPTASGDTSEQISSFYAAFGERPCEPSDVSLFRLGRRPLALRDHLLSQGAHRGSAHRRLLEEIPPRGFVGHGRLRCARCYP